MKSYGSFFKRGIVRWALLATVAGGFATVAHQDSTAGLASSSLIARTSSGMTYNDMSTRLNNSFLVLDSQGSVIWRSTNADVTVVDDNGDAVWTAELPQGYTLGNGHEFSWVCDARNAVVGQGAWMDNLDYDEDGSVTPGTTPNSDIEGNVGEGQVD